MRNSTKLLLVLAFLIFNTIFFIIGSLQQPTKISTSHEAAVDPLVEHLPFVAASSVTRDIPSETHTPPKTKKKHVYKTGFPGFKSTSVLCGGHTAPSCSECPQGHG